MKALVCLNRQINQEHIHNTVVRAFGIGLSQFNIDVLYTHIDWFNSRLKPLQIKPDFVVMFGTGTPYRGKRAKLKYDIVQWCLKHNIQVIYLEEGHIHRGEYWNVTVNGLMKNGTYLPDDLRELDASRIDSITTIEPFRWRGDCILVCKQVPHDANIDISEQEYIKWVDSIVNKLVKYYQGKFPIVVREHPKIDPTVKPIKEELKSTRFLITYSSTAAIDAALVGIPVYIESKNHLMSDLSINWKDLDTDCLPSFEKQCGVLNQVAHAQWTLDEMRSGECWNYLIKLKPMKELTNAS